MAYIANTAFEARITNNQFNDLCNITGRFQTSSTDDICSAGFLCVRGEQLPCAGFADVLNENAWYMTAAASTNTDEDGIFAANTYDVNYVQDTVTGNLYAVGANTLGLPIPKGRDGTFTHIIFDGMHVYRFGIGNLSATLSTNTFFTINNGLLVPAASAPTAAGSVYFSLIGEGTFTTGTSASFDYVDVIAKKVVATAD